MAALVTPQDLLDAAGRPRALRAAGLDVGALAPADMTVRGLGDVQALRFGPLSMLPRFPDGGLVTFLASRRYAAELVGATGHVVVTTPDLVDAVPAGNGIVTSTRSAKETFCELFERAVQAGSFEQIAGYRSPSARVHGRAVIEENVYIDDDAEIAPGAVLLSNTYVGRGTRVKPNVVIGDDGFETVRRGDAVRVVRHAGGVWLGEGVHVGSVSTVDKGLYGDFTVLGDYSQTDNHIYMAHAVVSGHRCTLAAGVIVLGWTQLGDDVWLGPASSVNQLLHIGSGAFIGTGSVVRHDVLPHTLVYGSTATQKGWSCLCHGRLESADHLQFDCRNCGRQYCLAGDELTLIAEV